MPAPPPAGPPARPPELRSRPTDPHPLFRGLVGAAVERSRASELFDVENA
ncbi:hypothetical protein [Microbacterium barkeri]